MKYIIKEYKELLKQVNEMSVEELLSCVVCPNVRANDEIDFSSIATFIHPTTKEEAVKTANSINLNRTNKSLIVSDMEAGSGSAIVGSTMFPSMRSFKETGDETLAYEVGLLAAKEAKEAGYHWTFGPCVDILFNPFSPITSIRSAGETKEDVIKYAGSYMQGLQDNGLIACLKHFPGDGATSFDQHITTPKNPLSKKQWDESYRIVYQTLIEKGAKSIMPGHIALPCYDEIDNITGCYPPATLSYNLITKLLKKDLGFEGIIISDATEMSGFCGYINYYDACARFLMSGGDCLLFTHPTLEFINEMKKRINNKTLSLDVLRNRAYRMLCFSKEYFDNPISSNHKIRQNLDEEVVNKSIKIFKDKKNLIPYNINNKKIAHVIIANQYPFNYTTELTKELSKYSNVTELNDPGCNKLKEIATSKEYDLIVCSIGCLQWYGTNQILLSGTIARNMMNGWMKYDTPVIFIDFGNPYLHLEYEVSIDTLVYTYGVTPITVKNLVNRIFNKY